MNPKIILFAIVSLVLLFISCEEQTDQKEQPFEADEVNLVQTNYFGCFLEETHKDYPASDTMFYDSAGDTLLLNVVMNQNCAACLADSVVTRQDTANIYVADTCGRLANCICDYRFQYHFTDFWEQMVFEVFYKPNGEPDFTLWGELAYP